MIYRRRIVLALIEQFGGELTAMRFQKLLFLLSDRQTQRAYYFVPYKYGCYSFQACADKQSLITEGYLNNAKPWTLARNSENNFYWYLDQSDRLALDQIKRNFKDMPVDELVRYVYLNYPFFAINSDIASKVLTDNELRIIDRIKQPKFVGEKLYTIGYEGRSLDQYLSMLIQNQITVLIDVRKNPLSRKFGFSKTTLSNVCNKLNIGYVHLPELGIPGEFRKNLNTQADYDDLFSLYRREILPGQSSSIQKIISLITDYKSVALTCFELSPDHCHRSVISKVVGQQHSSVTISHI
ncbi:MAG: DUF488 domain-containing protein [Bacteroidota bacterium]